MLSNPIKQREDELLLVIKMINEKREKTSVMMEDVFAVIKSKSHKDISSTAKKMAYPELTTNNITHCLYIKLNLTLKETIQLHHVPTEKLP